MRLGRGLIATSAIAMAGCATQRPVTVPVEGAPAPQISRPLTPVASPATYVARAASIDLFMIRASQLALTRSGNPAIRNFAREMIADHEGTAAQLSFAGRRLNLLPSATLLPREGQLLDELGSSATFDGAYLQAMRSEHGASYALHRAMGARGDSPTLRAVALNARDVEWKHLSWLRAIR